MPLNTGAPLYLSKPLGTDYFNEQRDISNNMALINEWAKLVVDHLVRPDPNVGTEHPVVVAGGAPGFMSGSDKAKLDSIQAGAINQDQADGSYVSVTGTAYNSERLGGYLAADFPRYALAGTFTTEQTFKAPFTTIRAPNAQDVGLRFQSTNSEGVSVDRWGLVYLRSSGNLVLRDYMAPTGEQDRVFFDPATGKVNAVYGLQEGGTDLDDLYLGASGTAIDSVKLGGFDAVEYAHIARDNSFQVSTTQSFGIIQAAVKAVLKRLEIGDSNVSTAMELETDTNALKVIADKGLKISSTVANSLVVAPSGRIGVGTDNPSHGMHLLGGGFYLQALPTSTFIAGTVVGPTGSATHTYIVFPVDRMGKRAPQAAVCNLVGSPDVLSETNYNVITWDPIPGAASYDVTKNGTNALLGNVTEPRIEDKGQALSAYTPPTRNETADLTVGGMIIQGSKQVLDTLVAGTGITISGTGNSRTITANTANITVVDPLSIQAVANNGLEISLSQADSYTSGYVSPTDYDYWSGKQDALGYTPLNKAGDTMTGVLTLAGDPTADLQAATKQYVDLKTATTYVTSFNNRTGTVTLTYQDVTTALNFTPLSTKGGTLTEGHLTLFQDPTLDAHAATKRYVDNLSRVATFNGRSGAVTLTNEDVVTALSVSPVDQEYVDNAIATSVKVDSIAYTNAGRPLITNVKQALDELLFVPLAVSLSGGSTFEKGQTVTTLNLTWTVNKSLDSQSLNNGVGTLDPAARSKSLTGLALTTDITYTLTAAVGGEVQTSSTVVRFQNKRYWGVHANATLTDTEIRALTSEFSTSRQQTRTFNASGGKYFYIIYPASFGAATFKVGGLSSSAVTLTSRNVVNASGHSELYHIYRSEYLQNGSSILVEVL